MSEATHPNTQTEEFVALLMANQRRLFAYLLALLPNIADAEDAMQETSIVLWRKFPEYRAGSDFAAWAMSIARNMARNHYAKQHRCRVKFDQQLFSAVAADLEVMQEELDLGRLALVDCVDELTPTDRNMLTLRYQPGATIKSVADAVGRPVEGTYKAMRRIHQRLHDCVQDKLTAEGIHVRES